MRELVLHKGMFPSRIRRFCTQELKVRPLYAYMNARVEAGEDVVNAVGIRREESAARSVVPEWEWSEGLDAEVWRPLVEWRLQDVIDIHARHGLAPNPLYLRGASRVGCWPCIYARKAEIRTVAETDPKRIDEIRELERLVGEAQDARAVARAEEPSEKRPAFFGLWQIGKGTRACAPIDEVVAWSKTAKGGKNFALFDEGPADEGCMRWGLCDTGGAP